MAPRIVRPDGSIDETAAAIGELRAKVDNLIAMTMEDRQAAVLYRSEIRQDVERIEAAVSMLTADVLAMKPEFQRARDARRLRELQEEEDTKNREAAEKRRASNLKIVGLSAAAVVAVMGLGQKVIDWGVDIIDFIAKHWNAKP